MCDTFVRFSPTGAIFAKNSDRPDDEPQVTRWHPPRPADPDGLGTQYLTIEDAATHGVLLSQPTWLWGAEHGVNDQGVAIGNERVYAARPPSEEPGLIGMDLVRLGLERAATADEALEVVTALLETHGQGGSCYAGRNETYDSSFLIADGRQGWILETFGAQWVASPVRDAAAISNRYSIGTEWTRAAVSVRPGWSTHDWHDPTVDTRRADGRLQATTSCSRRAGLQVTDAMAALRDHGSGPWGAVDPGPDPVPPPRAAGDDLSGITVCMHQPPGMATTASIVAELPARAGRPVIAWVCIGAPCVGTYQRVELPEVPPHLDEVATWLDAAARRAALDRLTSGR